MKKLLLILLLAFPAWAQNGSKIVTDANATGQTGAMQTGARAAAVTFTFCGTGFSGPIYVDAAATQVALAQVWTTTLAANSDCTTVYSYSPASKWYRVRWTRTAGTLNVWMNIQTGDTTAGGITGPVGGMTAGRPVLSAGATSLTDLPLGTSLQVLRTNGAGTAVEWSTPSPGVTNSAGANVITKSNGTNLVASSLSDSGTTVTTQGSIEQSSVVLGVNLIPTMTSLTAPSGAVTCDRQCNWYAFDGDDGTSWNQNSPPYDGPSWVVYQFPTATVVDSYAFRNDQAIYLPKTWTFSGSNDGVAWTALDTRTNVTGLSPNTTYTYTFTNSTAYTHYRLYVTLLQTNDPAFNPMKLNTLAFYSSAGSLVPNVTVNSTGVRTNQVAFDNANANTILRSGGAATLQLGAATSTSAPVAQTITVQGRTGTDVAGADWTHLGSLGAGTGASGKQIFQVGTPQATGTTRHVASTVLTLQDTGTAGVAAPQAIFADGSAGKPSVAFSSEQTTGLYRLSGTVGITVGAAPVLTVSSFPQVAIVGDTARLAFGTTADLFLSRPAAATLQLGAAASATPVAQTLQAQGSRSGTDTDVAGANLTIRPGAGTGAATGSTLIFQTPQATTTGTTAQVQTQRLVISPAQSRFNNNVVPEITDGWTIGTASGTLLWQSLYLSRATLGSKTKTLTNGSATAIATFTIADSTGYAGEMIYKVNVVKGAVLQVLAGRVRFSAVRTADTTYTLAINEVGTQAVAASSGTLSGAMEISATGGVVTISANFNSSLSAPTMTALMRFDSPDSGLTLTFP